jgi:hypothetical protein
MIECFTALKSPARRAAGSFRYPEVNLMSNGSGHSAFIKWVFVALTFALSCPFQAFASDWELEESGGGMRIETRETPDSGVDTIRGTLTVPWPATDVAKVIYDIETQRKYLVGLRELKVLSETKPVDGKGRRMVYQHTEHPGVDDRDVILKFTINTKASKKGPVVRITMKSTAKHNVPDKSGVVRVRKINGGWTISQTAKGARVVYRCHAEIGGYIPDFMVNKGQIGNLQTMFGRLKDVLRNRLGKK